MDYREALAYIHGLHRFGISLGLHRMQRLARVLGAPHEGLKVVHVGGTNGKGSTSAMAAAMLEAAGYRVGLYISPYLEDFRERIQLNGRPVAAERVADLAARVRPAVDRVARETGEHPTEFEVVTAMGFLYFQEEQVDVLILEVGLGGRYDATNIVSSPLVCALTPIDLDHVDRLGESLSAIAYDKAGIIKPGGVVVSAPQHPEALSVVERVCREQGARLFLGGRELTWRQVSASAEGQVIDLQVSGELSACGGGPRRYAGLFLRLPGPHQVVNAATAVGVVEALGGKGFTVQEEAVRRGLAGVRWPGRLEILGRSPWVVLDGAHNPAGAASLRRSLGLFPHRHLILVLGVLEDKQAGPMLDELVPPARVVLATRPSSPRALRAAVLAEMIRPYGRETVIEEDIALALEKALGLAGSGDLVLVCGSLYLVGEARSYLRNRLPGGKV